MAAIRHVALVVRDLQRMFDFYHGLFGFAQVRHRPGRAIHLSDGFFNLTLLGQRERTADEIKNDIEIDSAGAIGFNHFGFQVENLEDALGAVAQLGWQVAARSRPQDGRFVEERINDPEGNRVDLSENGFGTAGAKAVPGIRYLKIRADDPTRMADFYMRALALDRTPSETGTIALGDGDLSLKLLPATADHPRGIAAVGVQISNFDTFAKRLDSVDAGLKIATDSFQANPLPFIRDPDGNVVELLEAR